MSQNHAHGLTRRDFIKLSTLTLGGLALAGCKRDEIVQMTATPAPVAAPPIAPTLAPGTFADTILVNGNIVTMDAKRTKMKALAVKNGQILLVGLEPAVRAVAGPSTKVIDLRGRTVTPGLIDAHCHLSACGLLGTTYVDVSWPAINTIEQMNAKLKERIAKTPPGQWVLGAGWLSFDGRYPNKHDIDPISPKHPLLVINQGGHFAVVNSLALEMAGVNAKTPDPANGKFLREANNVPDGTIMNHPAMDYFRRLWPKDLLDQAAMEASILTPQAKFASYGVTTFQDVYARDMERMQAYFDLGKRHQMSIRGQIMNVLEYIQELNGRIPAIKAMQYEDDFMHFAGGKCQVDGAGEASFTHEPHNGIAWNLSVWKPDDLKQVVRAFHDAGYQVALHTFGDAAVDMALDAIEAAMKANPRRDPRHRLEHSVLNTDKALQRTKDLGVVISTQPTLIRAFGDGAERIWGSKRMQSMIPTRTWLKMGVPLCLGSDAPSMPWWDPQTTLAASILRITLSNKPVSPDQALTIDEAMYAHTMGGAYADFRREQEGLTGARQVRRPGRVERRSLHRRHGGYSQTESELTMVGGKIVHQV